MDGSEIYDRLRSAIDSMTCNNQTTGHLMCGCEDIIRFVCQQQHSSSLTVLGEGAFGVVVRLNNIIVDGGHVVFKVFFKADNDESVVEEANIQLLQDRNLHGFFAPHIGILKMPEASNTRNVIVMKEVKGQVLANAMYNPVFGVRIEIVVGVMDLLKRWYHANCQTGNEVIFADLHVGNMMTLKDLSAVLVDYGIVMPLNNKARSTLRDDAYMDFIEALWLSLRYCLNREGNFDNEHEKSHSLLGRLYDVVDMDSLWLELSKRDSGACVALRHHKTAKVFFNWLDPERVSRLETMKRQTFSSTG